ncbi:MAG: 50S ribosomal protein L35 [Acidimicrobiales bacterium]|jgi:large subunit ribosomal protein L35|nr:50S ribosomal protein L35 [Dehalococcoidia bacterium]MBU39214.1 50S ribosomal protein L35 [Acidimicrobiaceae bacterium]MDP6162325.1 50S ribosomal protein L35 [Acidimicrobiales bacterium]MEC7908727.1 50S ribosomal protein L35 [Actinomycetota bacterium]MDP6323158.1 50S ribosomal protein L35 [Acidimicrobiales bacterium]|tara:strand:+ start:830 stop:1024 length:195 start_codon:yes stop_codon:yes gene_type:complete
MPKMKTHRGAAKRIKVTGSGRLRRRKANKSHILEKKTSTRKRRLGKMTEVDGANSKAIRKQLGI